MSDEKDIAEMGMSRIRPRSLASLECLRLDFAEVAAACAETNRKMLACLPLLECVVLDLAEDGEPDFPAT